MTQPDILATLKQQALDVKAAVQADPYDAAVALQRLDTLVQGFGLPPLDFM